MSGKLDRRTCGAYAIRPYSLPAGGVVSNDPQSVVVRVGAYGIRPLGRPLRGRMIKQWGTSTIIRKLGRHTCGTYPIPPPRHTPKRPASTIPPPRLTSKQAASTIPPPRLTSKRPTFSIPPARPTPKRPTFSIPPARLTLKRAPSAIPRARLTPKRGTSGIPPGPSGSHFACKSDSLILKVYDVQRRCDSRVLETYYMHCG